jgi:hypothetical protein
VSTYLYAPFRYLKYTLPAFALVLVSVALPSSRTEPSDCRDLITYYLKVYTVVLLFSGITVLLRADVHLRFFAEAYFIIAPLLFLIFVSSFYDHRDSELYEKLLFFGTIVAFLLDVWSAIPEIGFNFYEQMTTTVERTTESHLSFAFGLFAVYFLVKGRYRLFTLSFLLTLFSLKKIALLAVALIALVYLISIMLRSVKILSGKFIPVAMVLLNMLYILFIFKFSHGDFDELFLQVTGLSADTFTMGRQTLYNEIITAMDHSLLWGNGLGKATYLLTTDRYQLLNLHSDVLKYFLEFGVPLFLAWIYFIYRITVGNLPLLVMTVYFNIMMLTDNVSIYTDFMTAFYLLASISYGAAVRGTLNFRTPTDPVGSFTTATGP